VLETIVFIPGAVAAGSNISLPAEAKRIDAVASAYLIRPTSQITLSSHGTHTHTENTAASYTQNATTSPASVADHTLTGANPRVAAVPTKVDEGTIRLDVATQLGDLLVLTYIPVGRRAKAA